VNALPHLEALAGLSCPEGGWAYAPDQPPHLEPTCLALLALAPEAQRFASVQPALAWLRSCRLPDGTFRLQRGRPEALWPTALALFTLAAHGAPEPELLPSAAVLLGVKGRLVPSEGDEQINDVDGNLLGWPWAESNFSWVEPTAWACLALRRAGAGDSPRVKEGQALLLDRTLPGGGLNYGNRRIFGISLEPIPAATALALLALQGVDDPRIRSSADWLIGVARTNDDLEHLCWARLALDVYRDHPGAAEAVALLRGRIEEAHAARAATPYLRSAPVRQALTALALNVEQANPFRLAPTKAAQPPAPRPPQSSRPPLGERVRGALQGLVVKATAHLRQTEPRATVHVAPITDYNADLADVVCRQYEAFRDRVPLAGKRVVLKPNLVEYHRDKVINTHPNVVAAAIELCKREGAAEVIVAEGPGHWRNVEYLVAASGLGDVLRHYKVPFIDLNHDEPVKRVNLARLTKLPHLYLARTVATADVVISLPRLKTHHWAVATLSLKNLFGTLPGTCYGWPKNELHWRGIDNSIVDIAATRTPELAIVDGIIGMEGDGPLNGTAKPMGVLVMGADLVAVDATCCRLMKLNPERVAYLVRAARQKLGLLGEAQVEQLGETIAGRAQEFATLPHFKEVWLGRSA
jgi:uncharacterized protein (DUF362 family)